MLAEAVGEEDWRPGQLYTVKDEKESHTDASNSKSPFCDLHAISTDSLECMKRAVQARK